MPDLVEKCSVCGALLDEEDLFCANCGTAAPTPADVAEPGRGAARPVGSGPATVDFQCDGCGASMSFDAKVGALRCPFCGNQRLTRTETTGLQARRAIPFALSRQQAIQTMRQWLGRGWWRPGNLARAAMITKISAVFVPYWIFQAKTHTYWTADSSQTPAGARGDWYPLSGEHHGRYTGLLVGASGALTPHETQNICPFDLAAAQAMEEVAMREAAVEQFRVKRKYARPLARQGLEARESEACRQYVPGRCRNMKVNIRIEDMASEPVLLPVWIAAYKYKNQTFRFLVNGQTGKAAGQAPVSWAKIATVILFAVLLILLILMLNHG